MNRLIRILVIALLSLGMLPSASAMFEMQDIHVISFVPGDKPGRYTLVFDAETTDYGDGMNLPRKKRHFTVRLRCDPAFCKIGEYRDAIQLLRRRIEHGPDIRIARMSGTGWRPVPGSRGVFESVGLRISKPPAHWKGPAVLLFIHDDRF